MEVSNRGLFIERHFSRSRGIIGLDVEGLDVEGLDVEELVD
jgi:hypothetical protein